MPSHRLGAITWVILYRGSIAGLVHHRDALLGIQLPRKRPLKARGVAVIQEAVGYRWRVLDLGTFSGTRQLADRWQEGNSRE